MQTVGQPKPWKHTALGRLANGVGFREAAMRPARAPRPCRENHELLITDVPNETSFMEQDDGTMLLTGASIDAAGHEDTTGHSVIFPTIMGDFAASFLDEDGSAIRAWGHLSGDTWIVNSMSLEDPKERS